MSVQHPPALTELVTGKKAIVTVLSIRPLEGTTDHAAVLVQIPEGYFSGTIQFTGAAPLPQEVWELEPLAEGTSIPMGHKL